MSLLYVVDNLVLDGSVYVLPILATIKIYLNIPKNHKNIVFICIKWVAQLFCVWVVNYTQNIHIGAWLILSVIISELHA